ACKAASAALSGLAFHQGVLRPSALHLPLCSGFAVLRSFCKTFVSLLHRAFPRPFFTAGLLHYILSAQKAQVSACKAQEKQSRRRPAPRAARENSRRGAAVD
ncbi:MAG TPA: hypothetical protein H9883_04540, partial [Candidatus Ruthenibacterium merdigallinarum]|nr:hypothetical protein [Candidatus Ruthenibacterium merdigallinarum]